MSDYYEALQKKEREKEIRLAMAPVMEYWARKIREEQPKRRYVWNEDRTEGITEEMAAFNRLKKRIIELERREQATNKLLLSLVKTFLDYTNRSQYSRLSSKEKSEINEALEESEKEHAQKVKQLSTDDYLNALRRQLRGEMA